jgi:hypothetical protein
VFGKIAQINDMHGYPEKFKTNSPVRDEMFIGNKLT